MKTKIIIIIIAVVVGLPAVASASSVVTSLIQGKSAEEAVVILAKQFNSLLNRIISLEEAQVETDKEVDEIRKGQEELKIQLAEQKKEEAKNLMCLELNKAPTGYGPVASDLVSYYEATLEGLAKAQAKPHFDTSRTDYCKTIINDKTASEDDMKKCDGMANILYWSDIKASTEPLYQKYITQCR